MSEERRWYEFHPTCYGWATKEEKAEHKVRETVEPSIDSKLCLAIRQNSDEWVVAFNRKDWTTRHLGPFKTLKEAKQVSKNAQVVEDLLAYKYGGGDEK